MKKKIFYLALIFLLLLVGCKSNSVENEDFKKSIEDMKSLIKSYELKVSDLENQLETQSNKIEELKSSLELKDNQNKNLIKENSELHTEKNSKDYYFEYYKSHFNPTISTKEAEKTIKDKATQVVNLLKEKNMLELSKYIHPTKGVRFTPYTNVSLKTDIVFNKEDIANFFKDEKKYLWGYFDGIGDDIFLNPTNYYNRFVYDEDYKNAEKISYNEVLSSGNNLENQYAIYHNSIIAEYYFSGFNPDYGGMDWRSLRLVFEEYNKKWYLVGIIHNEWTI